MLQSKNQFSLILLLILAVGVVSAVTVYAGESESFLLPENYDSYSIVGNSTPIDFNLTQDGLNVTIKFNKYSKNDFFEIIFFNSEKEVIPCPSCGGRGSSKTVYRDRNLTKYLDRKVEVIKNVPGETITVDKDVPTFPTKWKVSIGLGCLFILLLGLLLGRMFWGKEELDSEEELNPVAEPEEETNSEIDTDERGFEKYKYE